jgi:SAM-dependent methyltransferase
MAETLAEDTFDTHLAAGIHRNVARLLGARKDLAGKTVLDLACGDGRTTHLLRSLGATVAPYDLFPDICKLPDRPEFVDLQQPLPIPDNSVDFVVLQEVLEHLPNQLHPLQEIARVLKPGGELFLTTPTRSSLISKLCHLGFESENMKSPPNGQINGVWFDPVTGHRYFGHLFLIGVQQLRALALIAGFKKMALHPSEISKSSAWLFPFLYPFVFLVSYRAKRRGIRKAHEPRLSQEISEQFALNIHPRTLTNKFLIASFYK